MNRLDFFSLSPSFYIFRSEANKTTLGGILFLIFMIIMIFISFAYIYDFAVNDKYEIECNTIQTYAYNGVVSDQYNKSPDPPTDFEIELVTTDDVIDMTDQLSLIYWDYNGIEHIIKTSSYIYDQYSREGYYYYYMPKWKPSELHFKIIYNCGEEKCKEIEDYMLPKIMRVRISGKKFIFDNYAPIPVRFLDVYGDGMSFELNEQGFFKYKYGTIATTWTSSIYKEQKGISRIFNKLFNINDEYLFGNFETSYTTHDMIDSYNIIENENLIKLTELTNNLNSKYIEYKRSKIEFTDVLSTIGALFSTVNFVFAAIFKFYSKNFDNYNIVQKVLQFDKISNNKRQISLNLKKNETGGNNIMFPLIEIPDDKDNEINNKSSDFKNKNDDDIDINENKDVNELPEKNELIDKDNNINLPKINFFNFYLNNLYCCNKSKKIHKQEILNMCNDIVAQYSSIDTIIVNAMRLENLFLDYKWNNPNLSKLLNHELIIKLNNYLRLNFNDS